MTSRQSQAVFLSVLVLLGSLAACQFERPSDVPSVDATTVGFDVEPLAPSWVRAGESIEVVVRVVRETGFDAPIELSVESPPAGVIGEPGTIPAGAVEGRLRVSLAVAAGSPGSALDLTIRGDGGQGVRQTQLALRLKGGVGALDDSFGVVGVAASTSLVFGGALQIDGKYLLAAGAEILAFDDAGHPDAAFGNGGVLTPSTSGFDLSTPPQAFILPAAGGRFKVVLAGDLEPSASVTKLGGKVMQFAASGAPDPAFPVASFGLLGSLSVNLVTTDGSGAVYVAGDHDTGAGPEAVVVRLLPSGFRDTTFGVQGYLSWSNSVVTAIQSSAARILIAVVDGGGGRLHAVSPLGVADSAFGTDGTVVLDALLGQPGCQMLAVHLGFSTGGAAWVGGTTCLATVPRGALLRLSSSGVPDVGFAGDGVWWGLGDELGGVYSVAEMPDGTLAIIGAPRAQFANTSVYHLRGDGSHLLDVGAGGVREIPLATGGVVRISVDLDRPYLFGAGTLAGHAAVVRAWY